MKRLYIIMFCFITMMISITEVKAEDVFPEFSKSSIRLYVPIDAISFSYQEDLEHEVGFNFSYNINGQLFTELSQGHIQTITEGFSGTTDRDSPWKTLTELLAAYQKADINAVKALYSSDSQSVIAEWLSDATMEKRFMNFMRAVKNMNVLLGFDHKNGFLALVNVDYGVADSGFDKDVTPFFFVQAGSQYLLSTATLDEAIDVNISMFLQTGHSLAELKAPKRGLKVEKIGIGNGTVKGSGIDCGEDCIEVYVEGSSVWLQATPDQYSTFTGWQVNGAPLKERLVMKADTTVTAVFDKIPPKVYTLTVAKSGAGTGAIADSPAACDAAAPDCLTLASVYAGQPDSPAALSGITCGETCSTPYTEGTTISLKATPAVGSEFVGWQMDNASVTGKLELTKDATLTAVFEAAPASAMGVIVPAYFYPDLPNGYWGRFAAAAQTLHDKLIVIANPNNGPGAQLDANYQAALTLTQQNGGKVIGYVHTCYGSQTQPVPSSPLCPKTQASIQADIDAWFAWYPTLDGIFFDEAASVPEYAGYYQTLYDYVQTKRAGAVVVNNFGVAPDQAYLGIGAAIGCIFENDAAQFAGWTQSAGIARDRSFVLLYNASSADWQGLVNNLASKQIGWVYVTADTVPNPWDTLPAYFEEMVGVAANFSK